MRSSPNGLPIAMARCPTRTSSASPISKGKIGTSSGSAAARSGRTCREVIDEAGLDAIEDELAYFALLGYWFIEGRPALMDIDDNGVPCEFSPGVVDGVWAVGLIGPTGEISPAG